MTPAAEVRHTLSNPLVVWIGKKAMIVIDIAHAVLRIVQRMSFFTRKITNAARRI